MYTETVLMSIVYIYVQHETYIFYKYIYIYVITCKHIYVYMYKYTAHAMRSGQNLILMLVGCRSNLCSLVCNILGMSIYSTCREFFQET